MTRSTLRARGLWPVALIVSAGALVTPALGAAPAAARAGGGYRQVNLVSDQHMRAPLRDTDLVNAWGLAASPGTDAKPGSPLWVADNGTDKATLYAGTGPASVAKVGLVVNVRGMAPTGQVFNPFPHAFMVRDKRGHTGASLFIFDTENGTIDGWSPGVGAVGKNPSTTTFVAHRNAHAIYKGLAIGTVAGGGRCCTPRTSTPARSRRSTAGSTGSRCPAAASSTRICPRATRRSASPRSTLATVW